MKTPTLKHFLPALVLPLLLLASCKKDKCEQTVTYTTYQPVYMSYADMRAAVKSEGPQALKRPGKIYLKGNYIFVNEINKGIHIIDNSNPAAPQNIAFINIPGNVDIAATGNVLYADSYTDLLALDVSNPVNVSVLKRIENALPYPQYTNGYYADPNMGVVSDWKEKEITETLGGNCNGGGYYGKGPYVLEDVFTAVGNNSASGANVSYNPNVPGIGGSTAKFTIAGSALYIVDKSKLNVYSVASPANPVKAGEQNIGWSIETIYPYKNNLFIGSSSAVYIYNNSNPLSPVYVSTYDHITACDPVVVDDEYAYFTLSNDAPCHMGVNQLEVVDITDLAHPTLKTTVAMANPKGLGIDAKKLFICDSQDGLKVYDAADVMQLQNNQLAHFSNIHAADVIPYNNRLLMIGSDGLYQYEYTDIRNIALLSRIPVEQ